VDERRALGLDAVRARERVANLPRAGFTFVVSQVVYPALARLQDDQRRFRLLFLRSLHRVATFSIPASVGLAILAPELVHVVCAPEDVQELAGMLAISGVYRSPLRLLRSRTG
jgi:O-antigen/teichoic acid export membrane protein